jgi:hypothetical protein
LFALAVDRADARRQEARLSRLGIAARATRTVKHARAALNPFSTLRP